LRSGIIFYLLINCIFISCKYDKGKNESITEKHKNEILNTERGFAQLAKEKGLKVAFTTYAAEDAVLNRGNTLIKGKKAIDEYYTNQKLHNVSLEWEPEFIEVAVSGDLGYTYGPYTFTATDTTGKEIKSNGIFHTVWKKQANGEWRYVWD
jgi:ketosteroid isomerase-like protein